MANKLRTSSGRISFFAFQDMITTVTGVLLLITLLLTFYLNEPAVQPGRIRPQRGPRPVGASPGQIGRQPGGACASSSCRP